MQRKSSFVKLFRALLPRHHAIKPKSCSTSSSTTSLHSHPSSSSLAAYGELPPNVLSEWIETLENPFKLWQLRQISKEAATQITSRFSQIKQMDVRRITFDNIELNFDYESGEVEYDNLTWYYHPAGHKVMARFPSPTSVELVVDDHWSSKDVVALHESISMFRLSVEQISLDAAVVELIIASLSIIDLERFHAFLCFLKAVNSNDAHIAVERSNSAVDEIFFPCGREISIRTTEKDSSHLARILDYGVRSHGMFDRRNLEILKVIITDISLYTKSLNRNLYHFRCWCGSAGFDDRYCQQFVEFYP
jgi:hypothetical protein